MGGSIFLTLFFGLFLAVGVGIFGFGLHSMTMSKKAEHWPTVPGRIVSSDFIVDTDDDGTTYRAKINYVYDVMGRQITGDKIAYGYSASSGESFHRDIYHALPVDTRVAVRYDPSKPERAVLSFGINRSIIFLLIFGGIWTVFTLGMASMFILMEQGGQSLIDSMIIYSRG